MSARALLLAASLFLLPAVTAAQPRDADGAVATSDVGKITFPTSCDPAVQARFERGVAMLHSYWFGQARRTFEAVLERDPACAIAYWGIAVDLLGNSLAGPPSVKNAHEAWAALEKARAIGAKTQRERDWIEALSAYYRDHEKTAVEARLIAYNDAMSELSRRYPDDFEVQVFYALTLQASAPKSDTAYTNQLKSAAILERLLEQDPQHPGVSHFLIHAYDYAPLADKGLPAARRYAGLAPAAPHARHMPSHIYSMMGYWEDSIAANASALEVQRDYYHAMDFAVYAHLQLAQDARAKALTEEAHRVGRASAQGQGSVLGSHTALAAMPARLLLERGDWKAAAELLAPFPGRVGQADSLIHFTRGLGMARTGDTAGAKREIDAMDALRGRLQKSGNSYWADRTEEQMLAVAAWVALAEGARDQAVKLMRAAADNEDASVKHVAMENRLYPMRELYAELLLETGQAGPALREYEASLAATPNRYRGFWGAARAAEAAGDRKKAADYFAKLLALTKNADTTRPEIARANAFLAQR